MAEKWQNNDSAREMVRKYNQGADELNRIESTMLTINERYVALQPSEFVIEEDQEAAHA